MKNYWEEYYSTKSLDEIPWQRTQADWFKHVIDSGLVRGNTTIDLGSGTGKKKHISGSAWFQKSRWD